MNPEENILIASGCEMEQKSIFMGLENATTKIS